MSLAMAITNEEFAAMTWPEQCKVMRGLDNFASNCTGKTMSEADAKRRPYTQREKELRAIHVKQQQEWINRPQEAQNEVNAYLAGMTARGFVPLQETVDAILARHGVVAAS